MARRPAKPEPEEAWVFGTSPLRGAWELVKSRPALWAALSVPYAASLALGLAQTALLTAGRFTLAFSLRPLGSVASIAALLCGLAITAAMASELMAPPGLGGGSAFGRVIGRLGTVFGVGCVAVIALVPVSAVLVVGLRRASPDGMISGPVSPVTLAAWYILWLAASVRLGFVIPAAILTALGVREVFAHAWGLTRGRSRQLTPYYVLMLGPVWVMSSFVARVATTQSASYPDVVRVVAALLVVVVPTAWSVFALALTLQLWYRLRAEREGLGIQRATREMGVVGPSGGS